MNQDPGFDPELQSLVFLSHNPSVSAIDLGMAVLRYAGRDDFRRSIAADMMEDWLALAEGLNLFVLAGALAKLSPAGCALADRALSAARRTGTPLTRWPPGPSVPMGIVPPEGTRTRDHPPEPSKLRLVVMRLAIEGAMDASAPDLMRIGAASALCHADGLVEHALGAWLLLEMIHDPTAGSELRHHAAIGLGCTRRPEPTALGVEALVQQAGDTAFDVQTRTMAAVMISECNPESAQAAAAAYWSILTDTGIDFVSRRLAGLHLDLLGTAQHRWATTALRELMTAPATDDLSRVLAAAILENRPRGELRDLAIRTLRRIADDPRSSPSARTAAQQALGELRPWWKRAPRY